MPRTAHVVALVGACFVAFVVWVLGDSSRGTTAAAISDIVLVVLTLPVITLSAQAAMAKQGRIRLAWAMLTVGLAAWAIGEAIWTYYEVVLKESPFPSLADAAFLLFPVASCIALLILPDQQFGPFRVRAFLDGLIVAVSLFVVGWVTVLGPAYSVEHTNRLAFVVALAYPLSDVLVLTMAAVVLVRSGAGDRLPLTLVTVGVACMALSDSLFAYLSAKDAYISGGMLDIGWVAGLLFIAGGAVASRRPGRDIPTALELPSWASIWLPYVPLLVAGITAAVNPRELLRYPIVQAAAALLVIAVLARQFLAVSENRRLVAAVAEQASRDALTGLANRARFDERLRQAMELREREGVAVGVISLDLNDFKLINDNLGHHVGDELLVGVGNRLLGSVRSGDTVARPGGDEFCLVVAGSVEAAHLVADRVVAAFEQPFTIGRHALPMRPSVGLAIAEPGETLSAAELLQRADAAMYAAKRSGNRGVQIYHPDLQLATVEADAQMFAPAPATSEAGGVAAIQLLGDFRQAIANSELTLVYQPKFDLVTSRIVGVEALLRWTRPDGRLLTPHEFLPLVHRQGLTGSVTDFVLNRALDDALAWRSASFELPVAVNLFAASLTNRRIPAKISSALAERGLDPATLTVEVTEDMFLDNVELTRTVLEGLRDNGIRIAIDDFASGYSALPYLRELPIDEVKINRQFIAPILEDPRAANVVRGVMDLATALGLATIAEGIENAETVSWLREHGCRIGQGYFLSQPVSSDDLLSLLERVTGRRAETRSGRGVLG
ncbi:MAG: bifunctional diguanylate cyclase/phosphodiesterase [Mycobacterium sp.]